MVSIFSTFSVRLYRQQIIKTHRYAAKTTLLQLASQLEHYYQDQYTYEGATLAKLHFPPETETGFYEMKLVKLEKEHFLIQANPLGTQAEDLECAAFSLDEVGKKTITGTGLASDCWF